MFLVLVSSIGISFKNRSFKIRNSSIFFLRAIMDSAPDMAAAKPKKVLTEAQRLAFLKGREKRMANIEKKRLEKEEAKQVEEAPAPAPEPIPEMPTLKRAEPRSTSTPTPTIDENKIADTVAERVWAKLQSAKPKRKPYTRKEKTEVSPPPPPPPPTHSFTWM